VRERSLLLLLLLLAAACTSPSARPESAPEPTAAEPGPAPGPGGFAATAQGVAPAGASAQIVSQNVPTTLVSGDKALVTVVLRNNGSVAWSPAAGYSFHWVGNTTYFGWANSSLPGTINPAQTATLTFALTAPATLGVQTFSAGMYVASGSGATSGFFAQLLTAQINVIAAGSLNYADTIVTQNFPSSMTPGQSVAVSVTVQNLGAVTWVHGGSFMLYSRSSPSNLWGIVNSVVQTDTAQGSNYVFNFTIHAPTAAGSYTHLWQMYATGGIGFFGPQISVPVQVGSTPDGGVGDGGSAIGPTRFELVAGGQSVSGGTIHADIEVGHGISQNRISGGTLTLEGSAAVIP
jgi:hypothetical protein